jgi:hypothetical protein
MLGVLVPYKGIVFLILGDKRNPDDIHEWHASNATYSTQNSLDFVVANSFVAVEVSRVSEVYSGSLLLVAQLSLLCFCCCRRSMVPL